jgi:formyl-CoA transferase
MASNRERVAHRDEVTDALNAAFAAYDLADLLPRLDALGVPAGEVRTLDRVYDWDQTRSQGLVVEVDHSVLGPIEIPGPPIRFDDNAFAGGRAEHLPPPMLGEHNDSIRAWLDRLDAGDADG